MRRISLLVAAVLFATAGRTDVGGDKDKKGEEKGEKKAPKKAEATGEKQEEKKAEGGKEEVYESPREAFLAFRDAAKKGDGKTVCNSLTKQGANTMAARLVLGVALLERQGKGLGKAGGEQMEELI